MLFAEAMVAPGVDVADDVFGPLREALGVEGVVELGAWVGLQNLYSSFNRAFHVEAQGFCDGVETGSPTRAGPSAP